MYHHRPTRPVIIHPGYGRRTVIINNSGNTTNTGTNNTGSNNTAGTYTQQSNPAPKEITPEQKIARAERLAKEAGDNKKNSMKMLLVAGILLIIGLFVAFSTKQEGFEKYKLSGTVDVGYAFDNGFTYNGGRTEDACAKFYDETGIPLYFYTVNDYTEAVSCDAYTEKLYDKLFKDENHVLIAFYNSEDWWSWQYGANVSKFMADAEINELIDDIYFYWDDTSLSNDAVLAKGITRYMERLTSDKGGISGFASILLIVGSVMILVGIYQYINSGSEVKKYEEEVNRLEREIILSKPLETYENREMEDLKNKYDKM